VGARLGRDKPDGLSDFADTDVGEQMLQLHSRP
jgi:hypothetical protein